MKKALMTVLFMFLFCPTIFASDYYLGSTYLQGSADLKKDFYLITDIMYKGAPDSAQDINKRIVIAEITEELSPTSLATIKQLEKEVRQSGYSSTVPETGVEVRNDSVVGFNLDDNTFRVLYSRNIYENGTEEVVYDSKGKYVPYQSVYSSPEIFQRLYSNIKYYLILHPDEIANQPPKGV